MNTQGNTDHAHHTSSVGGRSVTPRALLLAAGALLVLLASLTSPTAAAAKVVCGAQPRQADVALGGVPIEPQVGHAYEAAVELSSAHAVNPSAVLMLQRCEGQRSERQSMQIDLPVSERAGGTMRSEFTLEFPRPGRWSATVMDLSGTFHGLGRYEVRPTAGSSGAAKGAGPETAALLVGAGVAALALALAMRRRGGSRDGGP